MAAPFIRPYDKSRDFSDGLHIVSSVIQPGRLRRAQNYSFSRPLIKVLTSSRLELLVHISGTNLMSCFRQKRALS